MSLTFFRSRQAILHCLTSWALLFPSISAVSSSCSAVPPRHFTNFDNCRPENVTEYNKLCNTNYSSDFLTLDQCQNVCGTGYAAYTSLGVLDAITTWVIPLFILVGNMIYLKLGRIGYWNYAATVSNLLGDPIITIMNLLAKQSTGRDNLSLARDVCPSVRENSLRHFHSSASTVNTLEFEKDLALVIWARNDYGENNQDGTKKEWAESLKDSLNNGYKTPKDPVHAIRNAAFKLSDSRVNNARRVILAVAAYLAAVSASFVKVKMSNDIEYHLPHTIALRELYYWLIPAIVLSSLAGGWPSQWTSLKILRELGEDLGCQSLAELKPMEAWSGGDYTFRTRGRGLAGDFLDFTLALASVVIAFAFSFTMSWNTPTKGLGCRGLTELGFLAGWILNAVATLLIRHGAVRWKRRDADYWTWKWVWIKNGALAVISFSMLLFPFLGWWNSCICWSGYWSLGVEAIVDLHLRERLIALSGNFYPIWILAAFFSQCILSIFMYLVVHLTVDRSFKFEWVSLNRRTDKSRREELKIKAVDSLWDDPVFRWLGPLRWKNWTDTLGDLYHQFREWCHKQTSRPKKRNIGSSA